MMSATNTRRTTLFLASLLPSVAVNGFVVAPSSRTSATASRQNDAVFVLNMGLFDGVKDAFTAPALERSVIDAERETPIDRWFGWSVVSEDQKQERSQAAAEFLDAMDATNYVAVELSKPMGIIFEENDEEFGGIFVQEIKPDGAAAANGVLQQGDQLVAVNAENVCGMPFDDALGTIVDAEGETTKLVLFRGAAQQFYGPTGASREWLQEFIAKGGVPVSSASSSASAATTA